MLKTIQTIACAITVFLSAPAAFADEIQTLLFKEVNESLLRANEVKANTLAPTSYGKAADLYRSAQEKFDKNASIDSIKKDLESAKALFAKAAKASAIADVTLVESIQARNGAEAAEAEQHAPEQWRDAEVKFAEAAKRLEAGNSKSAVRIAENAEALYEAAELNAIKNHYLNSARDLVAKAEKVKANRFAPETLTNAQQALAQAEKSLDENRYDLDQPRALAKDALYQAAHAIKITETARKVDDDDLTVEQLVLAMEAPVQSIGDTLDLKLAFDGSLEEPIEPVQEAIKVLQKDSAELVERNSQLVALEAQMSDLENRLGLQSDRLARQEEREQKIASVEGLFTDEEAIVLKKGDSVILRMIGLNFKSGKSNIDAEYFGLLRKVMTAINSFSNPNITIEGHTDSFGSDDINLKLSSERAEAVQTYLQTNMEAGTFSKILAQGYGESKPIANNETADGRRKNRRIDLVIQE
ncbi:OmpA family protein [Halioxenophilus aromaticivorans]|uniref:OmpA-like domain-containing protein n=1 Tax=Halioxenophilus aromaticivorans TaxID=1306992 RepID=A0AAV3U8M6_9ALTE